ncbi:peroxiredoxin-like family protein [Saccharicrinis fermentans]|uniref:thioredoxin-dependent peroxiredoxin n=1 Tax=Saccharicrinis fermentans DSM 9555 = JCM 21142 TaxID=869213 RepID=W7YB64_9BACT|nr:peroxiredoxin-like family protein [Saccharicrinis fermentans]GAF05662.1 putative peroxiredoxin/MT2597 [Saccharicrinis fermentans DSM 9555 = JCM 21142]
MKIMKIVSFCLLLTAVWACDNKKSNRSTTIKENSMEESNSMLQSEALEERKVNFGKKADQHIKKIYQDGLDAVRESGVLKLAKNIGDMAPNFTLKNAMGTEVSLQEYLKKGPVVLVWYRGGWCPYCNINLKFLQDELPNFKAQGANLVALTPELPDQSISTSEKLHLDFEVLSDVGNVVGQQYGVVFKLTQEVADIYNEKFGLNEHNGDDSNELPLAATYVIDTDGTIVYAFLDADYRKRAEPADITNFLKTMNK